MWWIYLNEDSRYLNYFYSRLANCGIIYDDPCVKPRTVFNNQGITGYKENT